MDIAYIHCYEISQAPPAHAISPERSVSSAFSLISVKSTFFKELTNASYVSFEQSSKETNEA